MFTGIVTDIGMIESVQRNEDAVFVIRTHYDLSKVALGASIACAGVCLTVTAKTATCFTVNVSQESLSRTTLGGWQVGTRINLERALCMGDELGGHIVSGHVDGVAIVENIQTTANTHQLTFAVPHQLKQYIAEKGSITLDGVSLTVNGIRDNQCWVTLIPHTWEHTCFSQLVIGMGMNLEIDMLARYVERMMAVAASS